MVYPSRAFPQARVCVLYLMQSLIYHGELVLQILFRYRGFLQAPTSCL